MSENYFVGLALVLFEEGEPENATLEEVMHLEAVGKEPLGASTFLKAVSYTHLDVYKRQSIRRSRISGRL